MTKFGRIVSLFVVLVVLFIAVFAASLNLPYYYESRFPISLLKPSPSLTFIQNSLPNKYIDYLLGPIYVNRYFITRDFNGKDINSFLINHTVIEKLNGQFIGHIYSKRYALIKEINNKIEKANKTRLSNIYKNQLQTINFYLHQKEEDINKLKKQVISLISSNTEIDRQYASIYFNSLLEANRAEQTITLLKKTNKGDYLTISDITKDKLLQNLTKQLHALKNTYNHLKLVRPGNDNRLKNVHQQIITIEEQINEQSKTIIKCLSNEVAINKNLEAKFFKFFKEKNNNRTILTAKFFDKIQVNIEQKLQLSAQAKAIQAKLDNLQASNNKPVLIKHRLFERLCHNLIILIGIIVLYLLYNTIKNIFTTETPVVSAKSNNKHDDKFNTIKNLLSNLDNTNSIAFFAEKAELVAAKFILDLRKKQQNSKIILVDFGNKIVTSQQNNFYGLNEVLCNRVDLKDAIFRDKSCDVDILYSHNISISLSSAIINRANEIIKKLEKTYDFIVYSVSNEPAIPLESFLKKNTAINIISSVFNDYEAKNWYWILQHLDYNNINFIDIKDL